jgi:hypothetical protein
MIYILIRKEKRRKKKNQTTTGNNMTTFNYHASLQTEENITTH